MPLHGGDTFTFIQAVASRYQFIKYPTPADVVSPELRQTGLHFARGVIHRVDSIVNISEVAIFTDGIVITSQTTDDGEVFWQDLYNFLTTEHSFRPLARKPRIRFISQIVVDFQRELSAVITGYERIIAYIQLALEEEYNVMLKLGLSKIEFDTDQAEKATLQVSKFIIERRVNMPFDQERYYCSAPLRTKEHVNLLEKIEGVLA